MLLSRNKFIYSSVTVLTIAETLLGTQVFGLNEDISQKPDSTTKKYANLEKLDQKVIKENALAFRKCMDLTLHKYILIRLLHKGKLIHNLR